MYTVPETVMRDRETDTKKDASPTTTAAVPLIMLREVLLFLRMPPTPSITLLSGLIVCSTFFTSERTFTVCCVLHF